MLAVSNGSVVMAESLELFVTSQRRFWVAACKADDASPLPSAAASRIERAFLDGQGPGLLHLATVEVKTSLPPTLAFARNIAQRYVTQLCHPEALPEALAEWSGIEAVGGRVSDLEAGRAAGIGRCFLVQTGHGLARADAVYDDIPAWRSILSAR